MKRIFQFVLVITLFAGCAKEEKHIEVTAQDYHNAVDRITDIMVHDIFSPPVASRIYAYSNIASYEIIAANNPSFESFASTYKDFTPIPPADASKQVNIKLAALMAQLEIGKHLIFSEESIIKYQDSLYSIWKGQNEQSFLDSQEYAMQVTGELKEWIHKDNYKETRTMPKFSVYSEDPSRWQPTPPTYMDGIEPHWEKIRTFAIDSASQFRPLPPPEFSMEENTVFYEELLEVFNVRNEMDKTGDTSEEIKVARFWDCNPYVSTQRGHLMFATKKITPGGHWIGVCKIAAKKSNLNFEETSYAYAATSIAIADGFISCWKEKYRSELVRPETLINKYVDENWSPVLQTPPFPEYPSGHSVVSGAAATVLTQLFGDNFYYQDDTEVPYGLPVRSFSSFNQAAEEAAISRLYGGIHYRTAIEQGLVQGRELGSFVVNDLKVENLRQPTAGL
jgi:hypothetical protein